MTYIPRLDTTGMSNNFHWYSNGNPFYVDLLVNGTVANTFQSEDSTFTIENLTPNTEYCLVARNGAHSSEPRRFVTGDYRFHPINYVHPKDNCYVESGHFLGSPMPALHREDFSQKGIFPVPPWSHLSAAASHLAMQSKGPWAVRQGPP